MSLRPRFGIRAKLLLASLALLAVPWVGVSFVQEMERFLRQGHEQSVATTAQAVATALNDKPKLFEPQPSTTSAWHEPGDLYLFSLPSAISWCMVVAAFSQLSSNIQISSCPFILFSQ